MIERRTGSIVGVSSAAGIIGVFGYTAYGPAKFAVRGLLEALRGEMAPHGIHVGCCFPPDVDTPQLAYENQFKPDETRAISGNIKPISAEQVANCIVDGIDQRRFALIPDRATRLLAVGAGLAPGIITRVTDRTVTKARAARPPSQTVTRGHDRAAGSPRLAGPTSGAVADGPAPSRARTLGHPGASRRSGATTPATRAVGGHGRPPGLAAADPVPGGDAAGGRGRRSTSCCPSSSTSGSRSPS